MTEPLLKQLLTELVEKKEYWLHAITHARWIADPKGGSYDCLHEYIKACAKVEVIEHVLKS